LPLTGVLFALGGVGMIGLPYVGLYLGHAQIDEGASIDGIHWVEPLLMIAAGVSAGAILRAAGRVFLGWGPKRDPLLTQQDEESPPSTERMRGLLLVVTAVMLALGLAVSLVPGLGQRAESGADRFRDRAAYAQFVLHGKPMPATPRSPFAIEPTTGTSVGYGLGTAAIALVAAAWGLWRRRIPSFIGPPVRVLRAAHSGIIGDYVMWIVVGTAIVGGVWAVTLR
jgi:multicomponent Na+:H+ antiporter subunit D